MGDILCLIAARGGSKRLPGKNIMPLAGRPLIAHSLEQARACEIFKTIAVSSDDKEILKAAAGADLFIKRPAELATDTASSLDVIAHAIREVGEKFDSIVFLQATSPLRLVEDIKKAVDIFQEKPVSSLLSVVKAKNLVEQGEIKDGYQVNGSIYIWDIARFLAEPKIVYSDTRLMEMPALRSVDIDYVYDFKLAELLIESGEYKHGESIAVINPVV